MKARLQLAALLLVPALLTAQDLPPIDSLATDSAAVPDSSSTERLLAVQGQSRVLLDPMPRVTFGGVQPAGSRILLTRDSIDWAAARTVSELLADHIPVYLWRAGWRGRAELPNYQSRGAGGIEYVVDGLPWVPLGPDSLAVDPSLWSLDFLEQVELERGPGLLRVFLWTRSHDRQATRTKVGVSTGDRALARYFGSFEKRFSSGIGLSLAGEYLGVNAPQEGTGQSTLTNGWAQLSWRPTPTFGVQLQTILQLPDREPLLPVEGEPGDTLDPGLMGSRTETQFRVSWQDRPGHLGLRADLFAARSQWSDSEDLERAEDESPVSHDVGTYGLMAGYRRPTWSAETQLLHHTEWTPLDARLALGWTPTSLITGSVEGVYREHAEDRTSEYLTGRLGTSFARGSRLLLGLRMPATLSAGATIRTGSRVDAPSLSDRAAIDFTDLEARLGLSGRILNLDLRWSRLGAWQPLPFRAFQRVAGFTPIPETEWLTVTARLAPNSWFALESNYQHPIGESMPEGTPPHHAWSSATISSRFLRNFPSGTFRLKVQAVAETWSPGIIGLDREGMAIEQPGLTFIRAIVQLKIGSFVAFWDRVNFQAVRKGMVPGYQILPMGSSYGIRWEFEN